LSSTDAALPQSRRLEDLLVSRRSRITLLALLIAGGAVLRFWGIRFGLPHDFSRPDEERITDAALGIFQGDLNPHVFLYPTFFIYLTAAADAVLFTIQRAIGTTASVADFVATATADPSSLHLTARILAAAAGVATIAVVYAAARELFSSRTALAAAAFVAVAFLHVRDSHFGVTDVPVSLMAVCACFDACYARMVNAGVRFVSAPRAETYGKVAVFVDLEGNRWDLLGPDPSI
jgi:hypothetical protein